MRLAPGHSFEGVEEAREACLVLLSGIADLTCAEQRYEGAGQRMSVFEEERVQRAPAL